LVCTASLTLAEKKTTITKKNIADVITALKKNFVEFFAGGWELLNEYKRRNESDRTLALLATSEKAVLNSFGSHERGRNEGSCQTGCYRKKLKLQTGIEYAWKNGKRKNS